MSETKENCFDVSWDGPIDKRLSAVKLTYNSRKNVFYHNITDIRNIPLRQWIKFAQEKLFETGDSSGAAIVSILISIFSFCLSNLDLFFSFVANEILE